ncbi:MAG: hypothetical protein LBL45_08755 [Treponema sp.]|nr:hypothetical protein [Treponema sp.]
MTLVEKQSAPGGNLYVVSLPIGKETFKPFIDWSERQCRKLGVDIKLNTTATAEFVDKIKPDAIVVATGSTPLKPPIKGIDKSHIFTVEDVR